MSELTTQLAEARAVRGDDDYVEAARLREAEALLAEAQVGGGVGPVARGGRRGAWTVLCREYLWRCSCSWSLLFHIVVLCCFF